MREKKDLLFGVYCNQVVVVGRARRSGALTQLAQHTGNAGELTEANGGVCIRKMKRDVKP